MCIIPKKVDAYDSSTIVAIDKYYTILSDYVENKTKYVRLERLKMKFQEKIWTTLSVALSKKIETLQGEQKLIFQTLRSKIDQRSSTDEFFSTTSDIASEWELINLINTLRSQQWLWSLTYNSLLAKAAYNHANDMYLHFPYDTDGDGSKELISHIGTDGTRVKERTQNVWYIPYFVGENIAYNQKTPTEVFQDRENSPTHYSNLIDEHPVEIGIAKIGPYWVMVIGKSRQNN